MGSRPSFLLQSMCSLSSPHTDGPPSGGVVGLLLCAGWGRRHGGDKLQHTLPDGRTVAQRAALQLQQGGCDRVVAVLRPNQQALGLGLSHLGVGIVWSDAAAVGMGHSLAAGVQVTAGAHGWVVALGDMPMVGRLFGSSLDDGKKTEIVLSITPRLVRNIYRPEGEALEFRSGTENSARERPLSGNPALPVPAPVTAAAPAPTPARAPAPAPAPLPAPVPAPVPAPAVMPVPAAVPKPLPLSVQPSVSAMAAARVSPAITRQLVDEGRDAP